METIHDKLNENFCIPNKPSAFHPQPTQWKREHFLRGGTTQNKVSQRWRVGFEKSLCLCVFSCFWGSPQGERPGKRDCQIMQSAFSENMKLERGNNAPFVAHFLKCPAHAGGAPFLALTKVSCLKSFTVSLIQITRAKAI